MRTFYEFFAGGGMTRAGLGPGWRCLAANDFDAAKARAYAANWGNDHLVIADVASLAASDLPGRVDLAWASPPCQDLSLAGERRGASGNKSGALWPFLDLIRRLADDGRGPRLIAIENVSGKLTASSGADFAGACGSLASSGYRIGAMMVEASLHVPQSRPRLVLLAATSDIAAPEGLVQAGPSADWHPARLVAAANGLPEKVREHWVWWSPQRPAGTVVALAGLLDPEDGTGVKWHSAKDTAALVALMTERDALRLDAAKMSQTTVVATITRRTRPAAVGGREQRAELRMDGIAGCLRTPGGGSSLQSIALAGSGRLRTRQLTPRECARLMGLPEDFKLPGSRIEALQLLGDGVVAPVVRHLASALFEPLLDASPISASTSGEVAGATRRAAKTGIKGATVASTIYLLPDELRRLRHLAIDLGVSVHELTLRGLDRVLAEAGERPIARYLGGGKR